jgi:hypothetical protein
MTDKVQKIREELARLKEETSIGLSEHENGVEQGRMEIINATSLFLDSLQEEPKFKTGDRIKPIDSCLGAPRTILEICDGWYVTDQGTLDFEYENNWELVEEPVSEELEEAANEIVNKAIPPLAVKYKDGTYVGKIMDCFDRKEFIDLVKAGAKWQKEQMMKDTIIAHVFGRETGKSLFCFKVDGDDYLIGHEVKVVILKDN